MALNAMQLTGQVNPVFQQQFGQNLGSFLSGRPAQLASINKFNPQAQNALSQLTGSAVQGFQNPYAGFAPIEEKARSQFFGSTVPSIAERFSGMGSNSLSSPALYSQLGAAGAGLEEGLAALKSQYGMQNRGQLLQELLAGITPQYEHMYQPREQGFLESIAGPLLQLLLQGGAAYATGGSSLPFTSALQGLGGK